MNNTSQNNNASLRLAAALTIVGQLTYVGVTQLHAGGHANDHHEIFETYAHDALWGGVHLGQFVAMAIMVAGLLALAKSLNGRSEVARWLSRFGAAAATVALALYAALQAVDGVALKQAVIAWTDAPEVEQAARFAAAESIRWLEWGMRSYQDFALGLALTALAAAAALSAQMSRLVALVMGLSGLAYISQGWIAGSEGFTAAQSIAIVLGWTLTLGWATWLAVTARHRKDLRSAHLQPIGTAFNA